MNHLLSVRTNILYAKKKDEYIRFQELIFLVDKPYYEQTNDGEIVRQRGVDEFRFAVSTKAIDQLIETLEEFKNATEEELS